MAETLRDAVRGDAAALAAVHVAAWRETYRGIVADGYLDRMSVARRAAKWRRSLVLPRPGVSILVVEDAEGLAGFGMAGPQREDDRTADAEVYALYLLRRVQGRGWGQRLMGMLAARMREWGAGSLDLWVLEGNAGAVAFYERLGGIRGEARGFRIARRPVRECTFVWPSIDKLIAGA
jgi:ribosomal protein S18 acetylase RimI-like enzyme